MTHIDDDVKTFPSDDDGGDAYVVSCVRGPRIPCRRRRSRREFRFARRREIDLGGPEIDRGDGVVCDSMKRSAFFSCGGHRRHGAVSIVVARVLRRRVVLTFFHRHRHRRAVFSYDE